VPLVAAEEGALEALVEDALAVKVVLRLDLGSREGSADEPPDSGRLVVLEVGPDELCSLGEFVVAGLRGVVEGAPPSLDVNVGAGESRLPCLRWRANPAGVETPLQTRSAAHDRRRILFQRMLSGAARSLRSYQGVSAATLFNI
jgi:hypothetical protein